MKQTILLGHPRYFRILKGGNPHTRDRWGRKKTVDRPLMLAQWERFRQSLADLGLNVLVLPPSVLHPGAVFPANAGMMVQGNVYLSRPNPLRWDERHLYQRFLQKHDFTVLEVPGLSVQWEGEADTFPAGDAYLFTYGALRRHRWRPRLGWPPYRRVYGFRTDVNALPPLEKLLTGHELLPLELCDERYYHGDTCLCTFGPRREFILAYLPALTPDSQERLRKRFGGRVIPIGEKDAAAFVANAHQIQTPQGLALIVTDRISDAAAGSIESRGVRLLRVDVSEFAVKGGGSVKCMLLDLS
ncbi:MAG: hypothetical protein HY594_03565 [Candidatus Omnitrophica bacterium]|nr:hypothetical protein [Candidatus Omnitrophota bacterium]